jgi:phage tail sheath protein FI
VTVIGPAPDGFRLLSDVTTDDDMAYRPANVNRLVNAIIRAARVIGEVSVFQNNGEALWRRLRESLADLLAGLWAAGALAGESAEEAFEVRCDRSTMTQTDLDSGRVICRISFTAAAPIVHVTVVLAMDEGGNISLASRPTLAALQAQAA